MYTEYDLTAVHLVLLHKFVENSYIYIYMYIYMHIHMHMYIYVYVYTHTHSPIHRVRVNSRMPSADAHNR